jgi:hypothetical protein
MRRICEVPFLGGMNFSTVLLKKITPTLSLFCMALNASTAAISVITSCLSVFCVPNWFEALTSISSITVISRSSSKTLIVETPIDDITPESGYDVIVFIVEDFWRPDQIKKWVQFYNEKFSYYKFFEDLYTNLVGIHNEIWELEAELKTGREAELALEEIGRRAIAIRDHNNKRVALKNAMAEKLNCLVREIKQDHLSE